MALAGRTKAPGPVGGFGLDTAPTLGNPPRCRGITQSPTRAAPRALHLLRQGLVNRPTLISRECELSDVAEAFARAEKRSPNFFKTVITL